MDNAMEPPAERNDRTLVTGGTGTLGRLVVPLLRDAGCKVRVLSRRSREAGEGIEFVTGDLATGEGIDAAVEGAEIIVHCAGSSKGDENKALNLVRAASRAGARHLVYISVVGADRIPVVSGVDRAMFGYFASKLAAERVVADSGLPWTTLRATQFHESFLTVARQMTRLPVIPAPAGFSFQPVDAGEVAARLAELALGTPAGLVPDMAGPRVYGMAALLRVYLQASRKHRPFVPVWLPGEAARAFRAGANLAPDRAVGLRTWEEFLADRVSSSAGPSARWTSGTRSSYFGRMRRSIVVFELNEVPWEILDDYVTARPTSALARVLARSHCYTSMTADRGHLSPWTTWPTLHRGVNDEQHMIASFGQDRSRSDRRFPPIWSLLHDARVSVGVCGTLHTYPAPEDLDSYAFYLPDAFASEPVAHPPELVDFQRFNLAMSRESARNVDTHIAKKDALGVLRHSRRLGIRPTTYAALGKQLLAERRRPAMSNRRRTYQSVLLFDIFAHQLKRSQPQFSTFFTNHLASAMHRYWAAHRPGDYERLGLGQDWVETFHDEVMWATGQAAEMVERLADHVDANPGSQLWIASSMGQRATMAETLETQLYLSHPARFLEAMGLPGKDGWQRRPAMLPQFNLVVEAEYVEPFRDALRTVRVGGQPLHFKRSDNGFFSLDFGQPNLHDRPDAVTIAGEARPIASLGLEIVEIEDRSGTTAYHVPEGVLAVYDPARPPAVNGSRPEVSVLEVAPTLLQTLGVEPPAYMARPKMLAELLPV